jgi:hypothetical protein
MKFGKVCFIEELGLRTKEEIQADIRQYKSKGQRKRMDELTYHHIIAKCNGGETTEENGAILRNINHVWLHRLPLEKQAIINQMLIQYKLEHYKEVEFEEVEELKSGILVASTIIVPREKEKGRFER